MVAVTPDEHAAAATQLLCDAAEEVADVAGDGGLTSNVVDVYRHVGYLTAAAQVHAMLAVRPGPAPVARVVGVLPTGLGAVIRARAEGISEPVIMSRLPDVDGDMFPWICGTGNAFADGDLRDVVVLYPGVTE